MREDEVVKWRAVPRFEGIYEVSNSGLVRRVGGPARQGPLHSKGYRRVQLCQNGTVESRYVHDLVAEAFIGERPDGAHIDHIDGDRSNNALSNLRYCTPLENRHYTMARGAHATGERHGIAKLTDEQVRIIQAAKASGRRFWGEKELAARFGVHRTTVQHAAVRKYLERNDG